MATNNRLQGGDESCRDTTRYFIIMIAKQAPIGHSGDVFSLGVPLEVHLEVHLETTLKLSLKYNYLRLCKTARANKNFHNFYILDGTSRDWRTSKFDPSNDNQLWRQDSQGRLINKANGKVFVWDRYGTRFEVLGFESVSIILIYVFRVQTRDLSGVSTNVSDPPKTEVKLAKSCKLGIDLIISA